jgi:hypothetical protein
MLNFLSPLLSLFELLAKFVTGFALTFLGNETKVLPGVDAVSLPLRGLRARWTDRTRAANGTQRVVRDVSSLR